jgi:hypothetical protein
MDVRCLDFDHEDFGTDAQDLLSAGIPFTFELVGAAHAAFAPHLVGRERHDPARMGTTPILQVLLALLMLAKVFQRHVSIEPGLSSTRFSIGFAQA